MTQMTATIQQWLEGVTPGTTAFNLLMILGSIGDRYSSCALTSAGLAITGGGSTTASTGSAATLVIANGITVSIPGSTALPALTGINFTTGQFVIVCFFCDSAGVLTTAGGGAGATLAAATWPAFPAGKALVGFLTITYAGTFTGGTTPLDTATTTYNNPLTAFDPSVLVGATSY